MEEVARMNEKGNQDILVLKDNGVLPTLNFYTSFPQEGLRNSRVGV